LIDRHNFLRYLLNCFTDKYIDFEKTTNFNLFWNMPDYCGKNEQWDIESILYSRLIRRVGGVKKSRMVRRLQAR